MKLFEFHYLTTQVVASTFTKHFPYTLNISSSRFELFSSHYAGNRKVSKFVETR